MIVVALPQVARDLGVDVAETSWIVTSYLIAMAALQPIAGRVGDRLGRRNVMLAALVYFAVASAGAAAAGSIDRKSTRLNSSHRTISYAVFCLKKKNEKEQKQIYS